MCCKQAQYSHVCLRRNFGGKEPLLVPGTFERGGGVDTAGFSTRIKFWRQRNGRRVFKDLHFLFTLYISILDDNHIFQMANESESREWEAIHLCIQCIHWCSYLFIFPNVYSLPSEFYEHTIHTMLAIMDNYFQFESWSKFIKIGTPQYSWCHMNCNDDIDEIFSLSVHM